MATLMEFAKMKKRADCKVCALPEATRAQLRVASDKRIDRRTVLEWLRVECAASITDGDMVTHVNGHHEDR